MSRLGLVVGFSTGYVFVRHGAHADDARTEQKELRWETIEAV